MIKGEFGGELIILVFWVLSILLSLVLGMRNEGSQKQQGGVPVPSSDRANGLISSSFRAFSSYLRIVSSGASTVARSAASVASSIVDKDDANRDQVNWAGFDKLEVDEDVTRRVLLLGYRSGFQVWDVEEANNVRDLVSKHDGPVSFMQMLPRAIGSNKSGDKFAESRPLLVLCTDGSVSTGCDNQDRFGAPRNMANSNCHELGNGNFMPTVVRFYSLRSQSYVHELKFRSVVYSVRCSSRVVAISQAAQIHLFDATTLEREYTFLTNPIVLGCPGFGGIGYGPLAVGPRWLAYSGSPIAVSNSGRVSPQHLTPSASFPGFSSNGSLVAHAKQSSKQLAVGIAALGDMGYKKLSMYCSELLPDGNNSLQSRSFGWKGNGTLNGHLTDADTVGMVIVRDIVSKAVISQFRAHKSPISALCFDSSGTLLVTASVQGHNINVFRITPRSSSSSDTGASYIHLYRLQRGFTNAVIQDISFSDDSNWIMISSSRGTNHLFAIKPMGGSVNFQSSENGGLGVEKVVQAQRPPYSGLKTPSQWTLFEAGPPVMLSAVSRIHNGINGWRGTVSGAAAAATGRMNSLSGAIASCFSHCRSNSSYVSGSSKAMYHLLVFTPSGSMVQYSLRISLDPMNVMSGLQTAYESPESDAGLVIEAIQKWNICKQSRREPEDNFDIYGDNGSVVDGNRKYTEANDTCTDAQMSPEEKHHSYISEAELHMHQARSPLWAKAEIYFQLITRDGTRLDEDNPSGGEMEIERIPTRMIEARSKHLVPVFDYLGSRRSLQTRVPASDGDDQKSVPFENGMHPRRSITASINSRAENGSGRAEFHNGVEETGWDRSRMVAETNDSTVNNNDSPETQTRLEVVNNIESLNTEAQLKLVNNNKGMKMENHLEDEDYDID